MFNDLVIYVICHYLVCLVSTVIHVFSLSEVQGDSG